jgi:S1-C subfamily serine protease
MSGFSGPMQANLFHAGNTCPGCQEAIEEHEVVVICSECGSVHHDTCWQREGGCSSYHCDDRVRSDPQELLPELVIEEKELENVVVPPPPLRQTPEEATKPFLRSGPVGFSWLAAAAMILTGLTLLGGAGTVLKMPVMLVGGIVCGLLAVIISVIAMVVINAKRQRGMPLALASLGSAIVLIIAWSVFTARVHRARSSSSRAYVNMRRDMPTDTQLSALPAYMANALRANVVVMTGPTSLLSGQAYGSGIIVRIDDDRRRIFILTNKHVVGTDKKARITVLFFNEEESDAVVEWLPEGDTDLALISCSTITIDSGKVTPMRIADTLANQGDPVFAVGNPMDLYWSYTEGVISGIREQQQPDGNITVYQTQTPINYGNSGGGLYNTAGTLIGVNTWMKDKSVSEGLNFAIATTSLLGLLSDEQKNRFLTTDSDAETPDITLE